MLFPAYLLSSRAMKPAFQLSGLLCLSLWSSSLAPAAPAANPPAVPASLKDAHRILFLGDSITYGGFYTVCVEAYFATRAPERRSNS